MRTTTRRIFKTEDVLYSGISYGTPIGQIMFLWINRDTAVLMYHEGILLRKFHDSTSAVKYANDFIKRTLAKGGIN